MSKPDALSGAALASYHHVHVDTTETIDESGGDKAEAHAVRSIPRLADVMAFEQHATSVALSSPDHGPRHWRDVARVGLLLCAADPTVDPKVVFLFAAAHDTQRENEYDDPEHGLRAARILFSLATEGVVYLDHGQGQLLDPAIAHHEKGQRSEDPTIGACWDADRLTLPRVGITPDDAYLSTPAATTQDMKDQALAIVTGPDESWEAIHVEYASIMHMREFFPPGELCDELAACLGEGGLTGMKMIRHKFVHTMYCEPEAGRMNRALAIKQKAAQEAWDARDWSSYLWLHERPYRLDALLEIEEVMDTESDAWAELVQSVWSDSENLHENAFEWRVILQSLGGGALTIDDKDKALVATLPDEFTIYRGTRNQEGAGMSWTLDRAQAEWFARRLLHEGEQSVLLTGTVDKASIIGYYSGRGEREVIVLPEDVQNIKRKTLAPAKLGRQPTSD